MLKYFLSIALLLLASPLWAVEALVGVYVADGLEIAVIRQSADIMRVQATFEDENGEEYFVLFEKDHRWFVIEAADEWLAIDLLAAENRDPKDLSKVSFKETDRRKTVAGINGVVFEVDDDGERFEMVLSDDERLADFSDAVMYFFQDLNFVFLGVRGGPADLLAQINRERERPYCLLELDDISFHAITTRNINADFFRLPSNVRIMDLDDDF